MIRPIIHFFFVVLGITPLTAQEYIGTAGHDMSIVRGPSGKIGYLESIWLQDIKDAKVIIPYRFDWAHEFNDDGFAVVEIANKFGVIDKTGKTVVPLEYDHASRPENGMAVVYRNGKFGAVDMTGRLVVPLEYETLGSFDEAGLASANKWGQDGIINKKNQVILPHDYIMAAPAGGGFMRSFGASGWKHFDPSGKEIISDREPAGFENGHFVTGKQGGPVGLFSKTGAVVLPEEYQAIEVGSNGTSAILQQNNLYGLFDLKTKSWLIPLENERIAFEGDKIVRVEKTNNAGPAYLATLTGQKLTTANFQDIRKFFDFGFQVKQNGKWGLIDHTGEIVLPTEFEEGSISFSGDGNRLTAMKAIDESCCGGLTDLKGNIIHPFHYSRPLSKKLLSPFSQSMSTHMYDVIKDRRTGKKGVVDKDGNWVLKPDEPYEDVSDLGASSFNDYGFLIPVKRNGKWGVYELNKRREIVPPTISFFLWDERSHSRFLVRDDKTDAGWGVVVYSTGQVFKPGKVGYDDYDEETKLLVVESGKKKGLMRLDGSMVTPLDYEHLSYDRESGMYYALKNRMVGFISPQGKTLIPFAFDQEGELPMTLMPAHFFDGQAKIKYKGESVLIDKTGKILRKVSASGAPLDSFFGESDLGKVKYSYAGYKVNDEDHWKFQINGKIYERVGDSSGSIKFSDDLAMLQQGGMFGFIDRAGNEVIPFIYTKANDFSGGIAFVATDKDAFYINRKGERLYTIDPYIIIARRSRSMAPIIKISEVVRTMDLSDAKKEFDAGAVFVDTRSAEGFAEEHIKGAINITKATLEANISQIPKGKKIIAYCSCPREESSSALVYELKKKGYTEVYALRTGTKAWKEAGYPMEK